MSAPRIGELFAGYGGLGMGVQAALGGEMAWYSEIDKGALKILAHRFPDVPNIGDITTVDWSQVEPVDILTGGFPCQDVSAAGRRAGLKHGTRSGLWHEFAKAIEALRPSVVVIENVRGLLTARGDTSDEYEAAVLRTQLSTNLREWLDDRRYRAINEGRTEDVQRLTTRTHRLMGLHNRAVAAARRAERRIVRAIGTVLGSLADLGYDASWHGLRAADIGAPHGRFRVFVVAHPASNSGGLWDRDGGPAWDANQSGLEGHGLNGERPGERPARATGSEPPLLSTPQARDHKGIPGDGFNTACLARDVSLLPTPAAHEPGGSLEDYHTRLKAHDGRDSTFAPLSMAVQDVSRWGDYAAAITRWEHVLGRPAPAPTQTSAKGNPQLSPAFVEWLMGLPAGWVTDVPGITRNEALRALGNGVVWQQAEAAIRWLLARMEAAA